MERISKGAEADIYRDGDSAIKVRTPKSYRIRQLDDSLRRARTRREAKVLEKVPPGIHAPKLISKDEGDMSITMSYVDGKKVRDVLDSDVSLCSQIGEKIALLHNAGIIHGDLTTSNMILKGKDVYLIDFGLSFFSLHEEDKAVDLHLFRQALESRHHKVHEKAFRLAIEGYARKAKGADATIKRLEKVESRGRHKKK